MLKLQVSVGSTSFLWVAISRTRQKTAPVRLELFLQTLVTPVPDGGTGIVEGEIV